MHCFVLVVLIELRPINQSLSMECIHCTFVHLCPVAYLPTFGRLNPESSQGGEECHSGMFWYSLWMSSSAPPPPPRSFYSSVHLLSQSVSLCPWDRHHWHWYKRWLPTNHLSTMTTRPGWETWDPVGGNLDLFCQICDSVIFWDECSAATLYFFKSIILF